MDAPPPVLDGTRSPPRAALAILVRVAARRIRPGIFALVGVLLAAGTAGYLLFLRTPARETPAVPADAGEVTLPPPTTLPAPGTGSIAEVPPPSPASAMPTLGESDDFLRGLASTLSSHPGLAGWLATEGLIRRFVAAADNVAAGESPRAHLGFLVPRDKFHTRTRGGRTYLDPASYTRYDEIADMVASLDPGGCAELYRRTTPLIDDAYRELGYSSQRFDDTLARAIATLLATPVVEGEVALTPKVVTFAFADPALEALSPAQKHLLRMGPRNVRAIQNQLRAIAEALALPDPIPPPAPGATAAPPSPTALNGAPVASRTRVMSLQAPFEDMEFARPQRTCALGGAARTKPEANHLPTNTGAPVHGWTGLQGKPHR